MFNTTLQRTIILYVYIIFYVLIFLGINKNSVYAHKDTKHLFLIYMMVLYNPLGPYAVFHPLKKTTHSYSVLNLRASRWRESITSGLVKYLLIGHSVIMLANQIPDRNIRRIMMRRKYNHGLSVGHLWMVWNAKRSDWLIKTSFLSFDGIAQNNKNLTLTHSLRLPCFFSCGECVYKVVTWKFYPNKLLKVSYLLMYTNLTCQRGSSPRVLSESASCNTVALLWNCIVSKQSS